MRTGMKFKLFFNKPFVKDGRMILYLWMALSVFYGHFQLTLRACAQDNYKIYKYVFLNTVEQFPRSRPFFDDVNHYGPVFGVIMAPFALMPDLIGATLWLVFFGVVLCCKGVATEALATPGYPFDLLQFDDYRPNKCEQLPSCLTPLSGRRRMVGQHL